MADYDSSTLTVLHVNTVDSEGNTALHNAIREDQDFNVLFSLLQRGADVSMRNAAGNTPFDSLQHRSIGTALNLLKLERTFDLRDDNGCTILHQMMNYLGDHVWGIIRPDDQETGHTGHSEQDELITLFWTEILHHRDEFNIDINVRCKFGQTPLHIAANFWPSMKHLEMMLNNIDEINPCITDNEGNTFLHVFLTSYSSQEDQQFNNRLLQGELKYLRAPVIKQLLNLPNKYGETPVCGYIKSGCDLPILRTLVEAGADLNTRDGQGDTMLHCILKKFTPTNGVFYDPTFDLSEEENCDENYAAKLQVLITNGALVNEQNNNGDTPLFFAYFVKCMETLLDFGASKEIRNRQGQTPLLSLLATPNIKKDVIETLLTRGANVNAVDIQESSVLHYIAWSFSPTNFLSTLLTFDVKFVPDNLGNLPCHIAHQQGHANMFNQLCRCNPVEHEERRHFRFIQEVHNFPDMFSKSDKEEVKPSQIFDRFDPFRGVNIIDMKTLPSFGLVKFEGEARVIRSTVYDLVHNLCSKVQEMHDFMLISLVETGSASEGTKVRLPNEFDYVCVFEKLGTMMYIDNENDNSDPGFVHLRLKNEFKDNAFRDLCDENGYLDTFEFRLKFWDALEDVFRTKTVCNHPNMLFLGHLFKGANCPTFHFSLRWIGCEYKDLIIDIDLVPACLIKGWWPPNTTTNTMGPNYASLLTATNTVGPKYDNLLTATNTVGPNYDSLLTATNTVGPNYVDLLTATNTVGHHNANQHTVANTVESDYADVHTITNTMGPNYAGVHTVTNTARPHYASMQEVLIMIQTELDDDYKPLRKQRMSALLAEKNFMRCIPDVARDAYIIAKSLCDARICPSIRHPEGANIVITDVFSSYMLKCCMFAVIHNMEPDNCGSITESMLFDLVVAIYQKLLHCSREKYLPLFMFPWQNVFEFDLKLDDSTKTLNREYREVFAKLMLEILGKSQNFSEELDKFNVDCNHFNDAENEKSD